MGFASSAFGSIGSGAGSGAAVGGAAGSGFGPIGAAAGIVGGGLLGAAGSIFNNERNLDAQREAQNYAKWLNERTWEREDSAVQRRVADLRRAGLSPVLAAGSSAQTGSPIKIDPAMSQDAFGAEGFTSGVTRAAQTQQSLYAAEAARTQALLNSAGVMKVVAQAAQAGAQAKQITKEWGLDGKDPYLHPKFYDQWGKRLEWLIQRLLPSVKEVGKAAARSGNKVVDTHKDSGGSFGSGATLPM